MMWQMIIFFSVMSTVWALAHTYVGRRVIGHLGWPRPVRRALWALLWAHFALGPMAMMSRSRVDPGPFYDAFQWASYLGMGAFTLLFCLMVFKDLGWGAFRLWERLGERRGAAGLLPDSLQSPAIPERREFLAKTLNAGVLSVAAVATPVGLYEARRTPRVVEVEVPIKGLPKGLEGFRIVQLSDIHVGPTIRGDKVREIVAVANGLAPDLVVITGDLVDGFVQRLSRDVAPLGELRARHGTWFCTGNHEYYWDAPAWCRYLEGIGIGVLQNRHTIVAHEGGRLLLAGCNDYSTLRRGGPEASNPKGALEGAGAHDVRILLAHQPKSIHAAVEAGYDLQLSGHTHGGQFWPWNMVVGLVHPFSVGLGKFGERTWIYVSRGTGYWGPPMRLGAPSEITLIRLVAGA